VMPVVRVPGVEQAIELAKPTHQARV